MDLYDLFASVRNAVARDATLAAWATAQFGKGFTVFAGLISKRMPDPDTDAPFIVLGEMQDVRGMESRTIGYELSGWIGLLSADIATDSDINVIEANGAEQIVDAHKLVRDAILAGLPSNIDLMDYSTMSDTLGVNDEVNGYFSVRFEEKLTIGMNPMH
jgi:hypothetical protein